MNPTPEDAADGAPRAVPWAERVLIVPASHRAIFQTRFQVDMYELFHRTWGGRLGHMIGTPSILLGSFVLLASAGAGLWPSLAFLAVLIGFGLLVDPLVAAVSAGLGALLIVLAGHLAELGPSLAAGLVFGGCFVQTMSHVFEDVPPPQSGEPRFVPSRQWFRRITFRETLRSFALTVGVFYWLELWATFRIWQLQILHVLMALGYRRELRASIDRRIDQILREPQSDWRRPRTPA